MIHANPFLIRASLGEIITIKGLGDVHFLRKDSDHDKFISDLKTRTTPQTFFIDLGDSLDAIGPGHKYFSVDQIRPEFFITKDSRGRLESASKPLLDAEVDGLCNTIAKHTQPEEWIGHISGNHPLFLLNNGLDLTQQLCARLNHRYLGYQAYVPINIQTKGDEKFSLMILASHGFGGAGQRWEGAGLNSYIQHAMRYDSWDVAMYGHRHDKWVKALARIRPYINHHTGERWVKDEIKLICQTGTYLRSLSNSLWPSYSEKKGMSPRPLGCISIQFKINRVRDKSRDRNLKIEYLNI